MHGEITMLQPLQESTDTIVTCTNVYHMTCNWCATFVHLVLALSFQLFFLFSGNIPLSTFLKTKSICSGPIFVKYLIRIQNTMLHAVTYKHDKYMSFGGWLSH